MFQTIKYRNSYILITTEGNRTTARAQLQDQARTTSKDFPSLRACKEWVRKQEATADKSQPATLVLNLATGEEQYFTTAPIEALISAAILADNCAGDLTNSFVRERYAKKILSSTRTASIGDLAVKL